MKRTHNPAKVTAAQLNPPTRKWRFLDRDEIKDRLIHMEIQMWSDCMGEWTNHGYTGNCPGITYRTYLTRRELAKLR